MMASDLSATPGPSHRLVFAEKYADGTLREVEGVVSALCCLDGCQWPASASLDPVRQQVMEKLEKALRLKTFGVYLCADIPHAGPCRERFPKSADVWCENCAREAARDEAIREALDLLKQEGTPR